MFLLKSLSFTASGFCPLVLWLPAFQYRRITEQAIFWTLFTLHRALQFDDSLSFSKGSHIYGSILLLLYVHKNYNNLFVFIWVLQRFFCLLFLTHVVSQNLELYGLFPLEGKIDGYSLGHNLSLFTKNTQIMLPTTQEGIATEDNVFLLSFCWHLNSKVFVLFPHNHSLVLFAAAFVSFPLLWF